MFPKLDKQIKFSVKSKFSISVNKSHAVQGVLVLGLTLVCLFSMASFLLPKKQISENQIIQTAKTQVKQSSSIIAGGEPVRWAMLINKSNITKNQSFIKLPKNSSNIKITFARI